jgi:hypothetical protein
MIICSPNLIAIFALSLLDYEKILNRFLMPIVPANYVGVCFLDV